MKTAYDEIEFEDVPTIAALKIIRQGAEMDGDDEAIEWAEIRRLILEREWGPILALPASDGDFFSGAQWEDGVDVSAFNTHDFWRMHGGDARKVRAAMAWAKREHQRATWMLETILDRIPGNAKYTVLRLLRQGVISSEQCTGEMARAAYWYARVLAARAKMRRVAEVRLGCGEE